MSTPSYTWSVLFDPTGSWVGRNTSGNWEVGGVFHLGQRQFGMYLDQFYGIHVNALGSTATDTNAAGSEAGAFLFYPWGQTWSSGSGPWEFSAFEYGDPPYLFPTLFRTYYPEFGRWLTPDPLGGDVTNPQSLNRYAYALNNPATFTDPLGLQPGDDSGYGGVDCRSWQYAESHAECQGPGSPWCFESDLYGGPCPTGTLGFPVGGGGYGGGGGGSASSAPPAGQPPLAGNAAFPNGSNVCSIIFIPGVGPQLSCTRTPFPSPGIIVGIGATVGSFAAYVLHKPWQMSWIVPLAPEPGVLGVGPAGDFAWNPATRTFCMGLGAGISAGHNAAIGPLLFAKTFNGIPAFPSGVNGILSGSSASFGGNLSNGFGGQVTANGAGIAAGPTLGAPGVSAAYTYSGCWSF